jgi:hypothetical protein
MLQQAKDMKSGSQYEAGDGELMQVVGRLLSTGKLADGLALAKVISEASPKSVGAVTMLAQAYRMNGLKFEAIQAYSKAIELSDTPRGLIGYTDSIRQLSNLEGAKP